MKKILLSMLLVMTFLTVFVGCASSKEPVVLGADGTPRPEWVRRMSKSDKVLHYEVGFGKLSNFATSLKKAEADARNKIALWVKTDVNTVLKTYTQDSGIGDQRELIEYMEEVSMQTAELSLAGAKVEEIWEAEDHGVYVLMSYDIEQAALLLEKQLAGSYKRNESAAFAEFKAKEAFEALQQSKATEAGVNSLL